MTRELNTPLHVLFPTMFPRFNLGKRGTLLTLWHQGARWPAFPARRHPPRLREGLDLTKGEEPARRSHYLPLRIACVLAPMTLPLSRPPSYSLCRCGPPDPVPTCGFGR